MQSAQAIMPSHQACVFTAICVSQNLFSNMWHIIRRGLGISCDLQ